jgi:hypothetical protein
MKETTLKTSTLCLIGLAALVSGCATAEYKQEAGICAARWLRVIPPDYEERLVDELRPERRPTGRIDCITRGHRTICEQEFMTVFVPYQVWVTVDVNKPERDAEIARCAAEACVARMGNGECK